MDDSIDKYTFYHFLGGIIIALLNQKPSVAFIIATSWEILEQGFLKEFFEWEETLVNSVFDIMAFMLGYFLTCSLGLKSEMKK